VLYPTPPSVRKQELKDTPYEFTPSLTTSCVKTSRLLVQVQTVFLKECVALSVRMSEQQLVSSVDNV
jgi:hypothetical protein